MGDAIAEEGGAVGLVPGTRTTALRAIAQEKIRQVQLAEDELREERNRQLLTEQARLVGGLTRAEIIAGTLDFTTN